MKSLLIKSAKQAVCVIVLLPILVGAVPQTGTSRTKPLVLTVQVEARKSVYKIDGREVEDRTDNSLIQNLTKAVRQRGTKIPVFVVIDVQAPLTEVSKLETALDKVDLTSDRRLFVGDFRSGTMNEIHWDEKALPIPKD